MPRSRPRTRDTGALPTPAVALGFCDSPHHHLQLKSAHGTCSTSLLWIRMKTVPPLYSSRFLPMHRRENDLVIGNKVRCRYLCAAFPVYEIFAVACLSCRLLPFL